MNKPKNPERPLYPPRKRDDPLKERLDTGHPRPHVEQAQQDEREKRAEVDERFKHLDEDIAAAQKKADDATRSHGVLGVGGAERKISH
jgi:hypothetical protein